ncbi:hypothetical protein [Limnochorda pilosa]|uniref:Uncharacterized protein n=1 Tax=Limnochorda pilosa TaxID=1555112 RepID=A0A0K2SG52_LIMPI|nr:hypothetical protein [Limnochorda pilosa]BAS26070.1 hypothetical protein LIP_0213 [Limnochorda pilosa]
MRSTWRGQARWIALGLVAAVAVLGFTFIGQAADQLREIPGITVADDHPNGCVDCHKPDSKYSLQAEVTNLADAGGHPDVASKMKEPADCLMCHESDGRLPMGEIMHVAHLTGGAENHFISGYDGECMYCHSLGDDGSIGVKGLE